MNKITNADHYVNDFSNPSQPPSPLPVFPDGIPSQLKSLNQWVCWRYEERDGKWTKPPYMPDGKRAKVNLTASRFPFVPCLTSCNQKGFDGVGFVLSENDGLVAFDFDHCVTDGKIRPDVQEIISKLRTYTEYSPSGEGIRIFCRGEKPGKRCKDQSKGYEIYSCDRYVTITGQTIKNFPIRECQPEINAAYERMFPEVRKNVTQERKGSVSPSDINDSELLERMFRGRNGDKWQALYNGDVSGYGSHSDADMALCGALAFYTGGDESRMDALFRSSGLMRDKWVEKHSGDGSTYGEMTISTAVANCTSVYEPQARRNNEKPVNTARQPTEKEKIIEKMNRHYAVIMVGGKCRIMKKYFDPVFEREDITFSPVTDFHTFHSNRMYSYKDEGGKTKTVSHSKLWLSSRQRKEYQGIIFAPPSKNRQTEPPKDYFNLWRGFGIEAKSTGEWGLYRKHVREVICNGNEDHFVWVLAWLARMVQDPGGDKPGTTIAMKGKKGTGKGTFCYPLRLIFGRHFLQLFNQRQITGNFNSHMKDKICLFCDEGFWGGSKQDEGVLKGLITEPTIPIEAKGQDLIEVQNHVNLIMATNNEWFIPTSFDERRFFVTELSDAHREDKAYFRKIREQMDNGGAEAMLYDLQRMDISKIDLRNAPKTAALLDQIECSLRPVERWWYQRLHDGENVAGAGGWLPEIEKKELYLDFKNYADVLNLRDRGISDRQFGRRLKNLAPKIDTKSRSRKPDELGRRPWVYRFASLEEHRGEIEELMKFTPEWEAPA